MNLDKLFLGLSLLVAMLSAIALFFNIVVLFFGEFSLGNTIFYAIIFLINLGVLIGLYKIIKLGEKYK